MSASVKPLLCGLLVLGLVLGSQASAFAEQVDSSTRSVARKLGNEGVQALQAGDPATATARLERAYRLLRVPSLALWSGRALEKSGKLVEASERYLEARRLPLEDAGDRAVQEKAQEEAREAHTSLAPRIPALVIEVRGAEVEGVEVTVNGVRMNSALLGEERPTNPGAVVAIAESRGRRTEARATLAEGETKRLTLTLVGAAAVSADTPVSPGESPVASPAGSSDPARAPSGSPPFASPSESSTQPSASAPAAATARVTAPSRGGSTQRTLGWIGIVTGGAGVLFGGISGIIVLDQNGQLAARCPDPSNCPEGNETAIFLVNGLRIASPVSLLAGGALAVGGVALLLTAPKATDGAWLRPYVGFASAGITGDF